MLNLRIPRSWIMNEKSSGNDASKVESVTAANDGTAKEEKFGRRIQDDIASKDPTRKLNLDRRVKNSDRRLADDPNYKGPSRRYTIDRRVNLKDRRKQG